MAGKMPVWPQWPEFVDDAPTLEKYQNEPEFAAVKKAIVQEYGEERLTRGWKKACAELAKVTEQIKERGQDVIPDVSFDDIQQTRISRTTMDSIREAGCVIVRKVIPAAEATQHLQDLKDYVARNQGRYTGFPRDHPSMYDLFNTPAQNKLRSSPALLQLMRWMNSLWDFSAEDDATPEPLVYADGFRIRTPKSNFMGLGPHIDAGGLARWGEPSYRAFYSDIFSGHPEKFNCYDMHKRKDANQAFYGGKHPSTVLRAFQGWTALSRNAPREGTIILYPFVAAVTAYVLLRPFFKPPSDPSKIMDADAWVFDPDGSWFPGTQKELGQLLSPSSHPHLHLKECMLPIPALDPGDTVWWHSDVSLPRGLGIVTDGVNWLTSLQMCHAVDPEHLGDEVASVVYIPAAPNTRINRDYARRQYKLMAAGLPPEDFAYGVDESKLDGFEGFRGNESLFQQLMGY